MSTDEQMNSAQRKTERKTYLKQQFYKRACQEGRGDKALESLRKLSAAVALTHSRSDDEIREQMNSWAEEERAEVRRIIEECVNKTDFDREEDDPLIRQYMIEDMEEQAFVIHILSEQGYPESKLPKINKAFARLNAYERREGREYRWSYNDDEHQILRNEVHAYAEKFRKLMNQKPATLTIN